MLHISDEYWSICLLRWTGWVVLLRFGYDSRESDVIPRLIERKIFGNKYVNLPIRVVWLNLEYAGFHKTCLSTIQPQRRILVNLHGSPSINPAPSRHCLRHGVVYNLCMDCNRARRGRLLLGLYPPSTASNTSPHALFTTSFSRICSRGCLSQFIAKAETQRHHF